MKAFALNEWRRAVDSRRSSEQLLETDPDSSASRAYYAAFHAVSALFALRGQEFSRHSGVRSAVHKELVNEGQWNAELGQDYDYLMDLRETGDYGGLRRVSRDDARSSLAAADRILNAVQRMCPDLAGKI